MKLKRILESKNIGLASQELRKILDSDNWMLNKKWPIFRGKELGEREDYNLVEVKETTKRNNPRNTSDVIDTFVHAFYESCYSEYPDRRNSRFGSTDISVAKNYGNVLFVVIPHFTADISHFYEDPIFVFEKCYKNIKAVVERSEEHPKHIKRLSDDLKFVVEKLEQLLNGEINYSDLLDIGCPGEILEEVKNDIERHIRKDIPNQLHQPLKGLFTSLNGYFNGVELGYPNKYAKDVIFQGKYIQVEISAYEKVIE